MRVTTTCGASQHGRASVSGKRARTPSGNYAFGGGVHNVPEGLAISPDEAVHACGCGRRSRFPMLGCSCPFSEAAVFRGAAP
jgi:hypothetical protein